MNHGSSRGPGADLSVVTVSATSLISYLGAVACRPVNWRLRNQTNVLRNLAFQLAWNLPTEQEPDKDHSRPFGLTVGVCLLCAMGHISLCKESVLLEGPRVPVANTIPYENTPGSPGPSREGQLPAGNFAFHFRTAHLRRWAVQFIKVIFATALR